jgi:hypothetical protein
MVIIIDTREQRPFKFNKYDTVTEVKGIPSLVYKNITFKSTDTIPSEIAGTISKKVAQL